MSGGTPLAIYDFDGTMISGDSIVAYLRFAHARKALTLRELCAAAAAGLLSRLGLLSAGEAKRRALRRIAELPEGNCRGEAKVRRLRAWLDENGITPDFPASAAYGDSAGDAPVLALTGHPTLVNPTRRALRKLKGRFPAVHWSDQRG